MFNILIFGMNDNPGGVESFLMNYARNFDKTKVHMDFLCNTKVVAYENELTDMGCKVIKVTARRDNPVRYKKDMKAFFKEHAAEYDVIWVNLCSLANIDYFIRIKPLCCLIRACPIVGCYPADFLFIDFVENTTKSGIHVF